MGSDQHFCLRWNNFHSNIAASFEHLRDHEEFVDVTLACEGRSLKAHKIVLSACSPYFKNLLKQNPCQHPIIILRDVAFPDLSALLSFVYQGEVYVSQERLPAFLRTAEMLHIKGLTEQSQNHHPQVRPGTPVSIGPPSATILQPLLPHEQGILTVKTGVGGPSPSPPSPPAHLQRLPIHISPPPKKHRSATTITALPGGNPIGPPPTPLTPPRMEVFAAGLPQEPHTGAPPPIPPLEGSTLAAALTKPLTSGALCPAESLGPVLSLSLSHGTLSPLVTTDVPKVKQETDEIKEEEMGTSEEAVNLMTEGSILRQRIQGLRSSPEALLGPHLHEESSTEEGFIPSDGDKLGPDGVELEKETMLGAPMVIRSPLVGLLPREAPGLFGAAGTSGSLTHQESSQGPQPSVKLGRPRYAGPRDCPHCGKRYSTIASLKYHVGLVHSVSDQVPCFYCSKWFECRTDLKKHLELAHNEHS